MISKKLYRYRCEICGFVYKNVKFIFLGSSMFLISYNFFDMLVDANNPICCQGINFKKDKDNIKFNIIPEEMGSIIN